MYKEHHQRFLEFLRTRQLKFTAQRGVILDAVVKAEKHLTAEELFDLIKKSDPGVGLATVYRNLKLLEEAGIVSSETYEGTATRYEVCDGACNHDHLICQSCGVMVDIYDKDIMPLHKRLAKENDFELLGHRLYLYGLCPACKRKKSEGDLE